MSSVLVFESMQVRWPSASPAFPAYIQHWPWLKTFFMFPSYFSIFAVVFFSSSDFFQDLHDNALSTVFDQRRCLLVHQSKPLTMKTLCDSTSSLTVLNKSWGACLLKTPLCHQFTSEIFKLLIFKLDFSHSFREISLSLTLDYRIYSGTSSSMIKKRDEISLSIWTAASD
jgi:hypothetical protein